MKGTHELGETTSRRAALGLLGGFAALAIGAAPPMHERATLDVDLEILDYHYAGEGVENGVVSLKGLPIDEPLDVDRVDVELANFTDNELVPVWFTWDKKRKTRHNWEIDSGPVPIEAGERARYELVAPGEDGQMNTGFPVQLTVIEKGTQRWKSVQFTPEGIDR